LSGFAIIKFGFTTEDSSLFAQLFPFLGFFFIVIAVANGMHVDGSVTRAQIGWKKETILYLNQDQYFILLSLPFLLYI
jgi:hypothetical protein